MEHEKPKINPGYVWAQILRALGRVDAEGEQRLHDWESVLRGLRDGSLRIGSRTPVTDTPAWVTLHVLHGGFASGRFAAGGPLSRHERDLATRLGLAADDALRGRLAAHLIQAIGTPDSELRDRLEQGTYRVDVPEEGALMAVSWLVDHGQNDRAARLLGEIGPWIARLRFHPRPSDHPARIEGGVALSTAGAVCDRLRAVRTRPQVACMNETLGVWRPLYARTVGLFLETAAGEPPHHVRSEHGGLERDGHGQPVVAGGWPCRRVPQDWSVRARELLDTYQRTRASHGRSGKPDRKGENFFTLREALAACIEDPRSLPEGRIRTVRKVLAGYVTRHGTPGSPAHDSRLAADAAVARRPTHAENSALLLRRLESLPADEGIPDLPTRLGPTTPEEAARNGGRTGEPLPEPVLRRARPAMESSPAALVASGVLRSSESLAWVLPARVAYARAQGIEDAALRRWFMLEYGAFRRRRSLLLLDLESQSGLHDLPWIQALEPWLSPASGTRADMEDTLVEIAGLAIRAFPYTMVPNRLVKELRALAKAAVLDVPMVDEIAADIFMGAFSEVFLRAGWVAARRLRGSLYERYYDAPFDRLLALDDVQDTHFRARTSPGFAALCAEMAGSPPGRSRPAVNGRILERAQILTTHNLAALFEVPGLAATLDPADLARRTFSWIRWQLRPRTTGWHVRLKTVKNVAYAWRQMVFYLSELESSEAATFLGWADAQLMAGPAALSAPIRPAVAGLRAVLDGERFDAEGLHAPTGGRRLLGWTDGRHWLLPGREPSKR